MDWSAIMAENRRRIESAARRWTNTIELSDARQECSIAVWQAHGKHNPELGAWASYVWRAMELGCYRSESRQPAVRIPLCEQRRRRRANQLVRPVVLSLDDGSLAAGRDTALAVEEPRYEATEMRGYLDDLLARIPAQWRDLVERQHGAFGRLPQTCAEIAADYGVSTQSVSEKARRAMRRLRAMVGRGGAA